MPRLPPAVASGETSASPLKSSRQADIRPFERRFVSVVVACDNRGVQDAYQADHHPRLQVLQGPDRH
jgi:hypothetical protein